MKTPFNMLIVGSTECGKTRYMLKMIEEHYNKYFEYIILLCPTFSWNDSYQEWKFINDPDFIVLECEHDHIDILLRHIIDVYKGSNTLIILDDCAASQDVKNGTSELVKLGFSARHYGLSTITITQQLTSIAKPYRNNMAMIIAFYNTDKNNMKTLIDEHLNGVRKKETKKINNYLKTNQYATLEINQRFPYMITN